VGAYLIGPDGAAVGFGQNSLGNTALKSLSAYTLNPVPGTWTLIVDFGTPVVGNEVSQPFSGSIKFNNVSVSASGLPNSKHTMLAAGTPVTVPVTITNTGIAPEAYFVDARLNSTTKISLQNIDPPPSSAGYPLPFVTNPPEWIVPTQTSKVKAEATATLPIVFDFGPNQGDPDIFAAAGPNNTATAHYKPSGGTVQNGIWYGFPTEVWPYPGPAPTGIANMTLTATTKAFDPAVTTDGGDLWTSAFDLSVLNTFAPIIINPGQTAVINVTITPAGASGTVVSGNLYINDFLGGVPPYGETAGDELAALPYTYTIQ
jgi:hypothetical protein